MRVPMAASRLGSAVHNSPLLIRQPATQNQNPDSRLPTGRCNFTNLSVGGNAPRCGCRRFWDKAATQAGNQVPSGFCMCEHHACYHDDAPEGQSSNLIHASAPMTDVVTSDGSTTIQNTPLRQPQYLAPIQERAELGGTNTSLRQENTVPDTAQWGQEVHSGAPSDMSLPAIPSQCLLPSENGSVTSYGGSSYLKPFGGLGLRSLSPCKAQPGQSKAQNEPEKRVQMYEDPQGNNFLQSPTEVATPSARVSQDPTEDLSKDIVIVQQALDKYAERRPRKEIAPRPEANGESSNQTASRPHPLILHNPDDENLLPRIKHVMGQLMDYPNKIQNHEHRLEQLENTSFSNGAIDDLRDDHDRVDTRVGELEDRVGDLDRQIATINDGSICGRQHVSSVVDCGGSVTSSAMIASAIDRVDSSRIEALEAQVAELQAALPSHTRPWELEVVFLPFGPRLMGIWSSPFSTSPRSRLGSTMTDEWTQTQQSLAAMQKVLASHDHASGWEKSATDLAEADSPWLMARACGIGSRADERLRSRGLVKTVQVCGSEARDVQAAIMKAFGDLPDTIAEDPYTPHDENSSTVPQSLKPYFGLSNFWIPLRKIHKDSCLRYLNPSEMLTPALWTSTFLSSSVVMRHSKIRRLYVTHRDAYIQHLSHSLTDWTWQKLRQLPRIYPDASFSQTHTPEADAHEPCWEYDERLDPPHESFHSSISSHISQLSIQPLLSPLPALVDEFDLEPASPSDHFSSAAASPHTATTPTSVAPTGHGHSVSPLKERRERDPFRTRPAMSERTISLPIKSPVLSIKRRMEGFHYENEEAQFYSSSSISNIHQQTTQTQLKRRRTQSPGREALFNPPPPLPAPPQNQQQTRFSAGPPSPYTYIDDITTTLSTREREAKGKERERGQTPFAYATPHSNAPFMELDRERSGAPISVYEDESVAGDENFGFAQGGLGDGEREDSHSVVDEVEADFYERGVGMSRSQRRKEEGEIEEKKRVKADVYEDEGEGSVDLDNSSRSPWLHNDAEDGEEVGNEDGEHERQVIDEEFEWEGVAESPGLPIGDVVHPDGEDYAGSQSSESGSEGENESPGAGRIFTERGRTGNADSNRRGGFMIHVDADEDSEDDELI